MIRVAVPVLLVGFALAVGGCGGEDAKTSSGQLVRLAYQGKLDFRMDASDGPEHILRLDEATVIRRTGEGSRTSATFDGSRAFHVRQTELDRLEEALGGLDLQDLEAGFGADEGDASTQTLTYEGDTVVLGGRLSAVNDGEGDEQAERFLKVESMIDRLSWRAFPATIKRANRHAEQRTGRLLHKLNQKARLGPTCDVARRLVRLNGKHLNADQKRRIYSRVRSSEQPCP